MPARPDTAGTNRRVLDDSNACRDLGWTEIAEQSAVDALVNHLGAPADSDDVGRLQARLAALQAQRRLVEEQNWATRRRRLLQAAFGAAGILSLLWLIPVSSSAVVLRAETRRVSFVSARPQLIAHRILAKRVRLSKPSSLRVSSGASESNEISDVEFSDVEIGPLALNSLDEVALRAIGPATIQLSILRKDTAGSAGIDVALNSLGRTADDPSRIGDHVEAHWAVGEPGLLIDFDLDAPIEMLPVSVLNPRFMDGGGSYRDSEGRLGAIPALSALVKGSLALTDYPNIRIDIGERERIDLGESGGVFERFAVGPQSVEISFAGRARRVLTGLGETERDRRPNLLYWLVGQNESGNAWAAAAALATLVGTLWSMFSRR